MRSSPRPEPPARAPRAPRRGHNAGRAAIALACALWAAAPARGDERVLFGGLFDAEFWKTDDGSRLLSRNDGAAAPAGRLRLWAAGEFREGLQGFLRGEVESERDYGETEVEAELEQAFVRYTFKAPRRLVLEAGRILTPIGNFSRRYLSSANPLIGEPDSYSVSYPLGVQITGRAAAFDYRVAVVDEPLVNTGYVPEGDRSFRPAIALGVTPVVGTRLGAYATRGSYLGRDQEPFLPSGSGWKEFGQIVYGLDVQFSRGHFELNGDFARSGYEIPGAVRDARGRAWFLETRYTVHPRVFLALRYERNAYPYIEPLAPSVWLAAMATVSDIEAGAGYRLSPAALLKVAYRKDRWNVPPAEEPDFPAGYSISAQLSYTFDVNSWFDRPR